METKYTMSDQFLTPQGVYLPTGEYRDRQLVRAYEPGANGRIGVGNLLRYCELAANLASRKAGFGPEWYYSRGEGWVVFRQTLELSAPARVGDAVDLMTWVRGYTRVSAQRDYLITHATTGQTVARGTATWAYVDRALQTPKRVPQDILDQFPRPLRIALPERLPWGAPLAAPPPETRLEIWARGYEADSLKHINNCVYGDWLAEAARLSFQQWASMPNYADLLPVNLTPRRLSIHYQRSAMPGDVITITSRLERAASRGLVLGQTATLRDDPTTPLVTATAWFVGM